MAIGLFANLVIPFQLNIWFCRENLYELSLDLFVPTNMLRTQLQQNNNRQVLNAYFSSSDFKHSVTPKLAY